MSDIDPAEISVTSRRIGQEKFSQDLPDVPPVPPPTGRLEREGLPTGYRMRADAHYVEQLSARRAELGRAAVQPDMPDGSRDAAASDHWSDGLLAQLHDEITSLNAAVALLSAEGTSLARRLGVDVVRAQAWRAGWLLKAHALVEGHDRGRVRTRPLASALEQVRQGLAAECQLAGITLKIQATDWNASVAIDESAFVAGVSGAVVATLGILGPSDGATVRLHVDASSPDVRSIEVSQDEVSLPPQSAPRVFEASWTDRPGGWMAGLGAAVAKAVAIQHGGTATFSVGERRGTTLRMTFLRGGH